MKLSAVANPISNELITLSKDVNIRPSVKKLRLTEVNTTINMDSSITMSIKEIKDRYCATSKKFYTRKNPNHLYSQIPNVNIIEKSCINLLDS